MPIAKSILLLATSIALASCAVGPPKQNALKSGVYGFSNAGLIVGRIASDAMFGTGIEFKSLSTGASFTYTGATDFSMWLPEGDYEVSGIGSRQGSLGPFRIPLTFRVEKGQIAYLGTISYGCTRRSITKAWYGLKDCGFLDLSDRCTVAEPGIPMCVLDDQTESIESFRATNPDLASAPVRSALMKLGGRR